MIAGADPSTREELKRDIAELDHLIEEILLASRLEAVTGLERREPIDLLALAAEEAPAPLGHRLAHVLGDGYPVGLRCGGQ